MAYDNQGQRPYRSNHNQGGGDRNQYRSDRQEQEPSIFTRRIRAGKRRTYFFDVRATRSRDYFITITESKRNFEDDTYERHKIFLYKEDFNKFIAGLTETINFVKTDLMPDFDFDSFSHEPEDDYSYAGHPAAHANAVAILPEDTVNTAILEAIPAEEEPLRHNNHLDGWKA